jgi:thiamine-phosphate pyrophosphorylase
VNPKPWRYAITDCTQLPADQQKPHSAVDRQVALNLQAARLAEAGIDFLQLREKDLPTSELVALARSLLYTLRSSSTKLLINARADVAVAVAAHGVHLMSSREELTPRQVHDLYDLANLSSPIVTVACHSLEDVMRHRLEPISAILFGPVFEKVVSNKKISAEGTGLVLLHQACLAAAPVPVLALGGITLANISACLQAGAGGIAGIRLFQRA